MSFLSPKRNATPSELIMSRVDELLAIAETAEARAMRVAEEYANAHDTVASLRHRLAKAEAELARLASASEEAELAHREASRDLELEVDQVEDGAYDALWA
jgi:chromosome segregation ATPase